MLNCLYGKSLSKPKRTKVMLYKTESEFTEAHNHYRPIVKNYKHAKEGWRLVLGRCFDRTYNLCHFGVGVLSQARKLMNHLFELGDSNNIEIYYTHTDSFIIQKEHLGKLQRLIGTGLGQLKIENEGNVKIVKGKKPVFT
jgi:hypothetical protein